MATKTIETRKTKNGTRYRGRVRITLLGQTVANTSRTFETYKEAMRWVNQTAKLASLEGVQGLDKAKKHNCFLVEDAVLSVLNEEPTASRLSKNKKSNLKLILSCPIAKIPLEELNEQHIYQHCVYRANSSSAPKSQTIAHDISNLCTALKDAVTFFGYNVNVAVFSNARSSLQRHRFISRSEERTRRPTQLELNGIRTALEECIIQNSNGLPLLDIIDFALETCLRRSEIANVRQSDVDWDNQTLTVHNRKNPNSQKNTCVIPLSKTALEIIASQPNDEFDDRVFPFQPDAISGAWRNTVKHLNIEDLRFHDLRAEGACRLFEEGLNVIQISKITGHRNLDVLNNHYLRVNVKKLKLAS